MPFQMPVSELCKVNRSTETQTALQTLLSRRRQEVIALYDVGQHMMAQGFTDTEIINGLIKLTHDKAIELLPGNQLRVLRRTYQSMTPYVRY